jgi:hypothetical protein
MPHPLLLRASSLLIFALLLALLLWRRGRRR